jgi:hypothetical protein
LDYNTVAEVEAIKAAAVSPQIEPTTPESQTNNKRKQNSTQQNRHSWAPDMNVRVVLEHQYPQGSDPRRFSYSSMSHQEPMRHPSIRRRKSRSGLKEYVAKQALQEIAQSELHDRRATGGDKFNEGT